MRPLMSMLAEGVFVVLCVFVAVKWKSPTLGSFGPLTYLVIDEDRRLFVL